MKCKPAIIAAEVWGSNWQKSDGSCFVASSAESNKLNTLWLVIGSTRFCRAQTVVESQIMSEGWEFYFCKVDEKPASIFVNLGIRDLAPIPDLTDLTWLRLQMLHPRQDGLSSNEEFDRLNEIEDALEKGVSTSDAKIEFVGRNTSDNHRDYYFYTNNSHIAEHCLSAAMIPFSEYQFEIGSRSEPKWDAYFEFLVPSPRAYQMILNDHVLRHLQKLGDRLEIEREVCHWIYFSSNDDRSRFKTAAARSGFKVDELESIEGKRPFGLTAANLTAIDYATINNVVLQLFDLAQEFDGEYDGWETSVENGEAP